MKFRFVSVVLTVTHAMHLIPAIFHRPTKKKTTVGPDTGERRLSGFLPNWHGDKLRKVVTGRSAVAASRTQSGAGFFRIVSFSTYDLYDITHR